MSQPCANPNKRKSENKDEAEPERKKVKPAIESEVDGFTERILDRCTELQEVIDEIVFKGKTPTDNRLHELLDIMIKIKMPSVQSFADVLMEGVFEITEGAKPRRTFELTNGKRVPEFEWTLAKSTLHHGPFRYSKQSKGFFFYANRLNFDGHGFDLVDLSKGFMGLGALTHPDKKQSELYSESGDWEEEQDTANAKRLLENLKDDSTLFLFAILYQNRPWVIKDALSKLFEIEHVDVDLTRGGEAKTVFKYPDSHVLFDMCEPFLDTFMSADLVECMMEAGLIHKLVQRDISLQVVIESIYFTKYIYGDPEETRRITIKMSETFRRRHRERKACIHALLLSLGFDCDTVLKTRTVLLILHYL